jgi:hypothetical protein
MYPIVTHPQFTHHTSQVSYFHKHVTFAMPVQTAKLVLDQWTGTVLTLWKVGADRIDMGLDGEAFFALAAVAAALLGLVDLCVRPRAWKAVLVVIAAFGLLPRVLSHDPHTAKLLGVVAPLGLLGAAALDRVVGAAGRLRGGRLWAWTAFLLILGLWAWDGRVMAHRFFVRIPAVASNDSTVHLHSRRDTEAGRRVYLHLANHFYSPATQGVLSDGLEVFMIQEQPVLIDLGPTDPVPETVVYIHGARRDARDRVEREYPGVRWEEVRLYYQGPSDAPMMSKGYLPPGSIPQVQVGQASPKWIAYRRFSGNSWRRRLFAHRVGLCHGIVEYEDRSEDPLAPIPWNNGSHSAVLEGTVGLPRDGEYVFSVEAANYAVLSVDGKEVLDHRPKKGTETRESRVKLRAGTHRVAYRTFYQYGLDTPQVFVRFPGEPTGRVLGTW